MDIDHRVGVGVDRDRAGAVDAVLRGQGVQPVLHRLALIPQCHNQIAEHHGRADAVLVAHGIGVDAVPDGLLVGIPQRGTGDVLVGARQPFETGQGFDVVGPVVGGDRGEQLR